MNLLARLAWGRRARAVTAALAGAGADGPVVVLGAPRLGRVLGQRGLAVVVAGVHAPALRWLGGRSLCAKPDRLPFADGALGALVTVGPGWSEDWLRALRPGGTLVLLAAETAVEQSRRALCAGLVDLEQRRAGRLVVTSGRRWR